MENSNYLGNEKVGKLLRQFSIPCICSLIISCLYNIVDQIFVGNMIGYVANGATGIIFPITVVGWGMSLFFVMALRLLFLFPLEEMKQRAFIGAWETDCFGLLFPALPLSP